MSAVTLPFEPAEDAIPGGSRRAAARLVLAAAAIIALMSGGSLLVERLELGTPFAIQAVRFDGELAHVAESDLQRAVSSVLDGGLFGADLGAIRARLEDLPWVAGATVRRVWPDALRITVDEQTAAANWGEVALVNPKGEVFRPAERPEGRPQLAGPEGSAGDVLARFRAMRPRFEGIGLTLAGLELDERRSWRARLAGGGVVVLGREDLDARIRRLVAAWPRVRAGGVARRPAYVDLRYPNGLSVRWQPVATQGEKESEE